MSGLRSALEGAGSTDEPRFVKIYIDNICSVHGLNTTQTKIYFFMLQHMNWENISVYGPSAKGKFLAENKMKNSTYNNNVSVMIRSGLIDRVGRAEYLINKQYAVKTDWSRVKKIKWFREYDEDGVIKDAVTLERNDT